MMYSYMTLPDGTEINHTQVLTEKGAPTVEVHFERPVDGGFKSARCELPSYTWLFNDGYSDSEIAFFTELLHHNAHTIFDFAANGGSKIA